MNDQDKCLADQMYDEWEKQPEQRENSSATGGGGEKVLYCVDGATLYCTMGSSSSRLRVNDHGVRLTGIPAAHDGDRAPNENIFPFGSCKLKDNKPCTPAPVGRWLLPDEYAIIGSCYAGKRAHAKRAGELKHTAMKALMPFCTAVFALPRRQMPQVDTMARYELYRALRTLRYEQERISILCVHPFTNMKEIVDYFESIQNSMKYAQNAVQTIETVLNELENYRPLFETQFKSALNSTFYEDMLKNFNQGIMRGLHRGDREGYKVILSEIGSDAEQAMEKMKELLAEAKAYTEPENMDQGCQITVNSIIPCQLGGTIYV